tara:strand:- start:9006 stop:9626 length:621 start_codon:yes stop_codon:yes gene_type:complete
MSNILLMGNGPSVLKDKKGTLIDSDKFDIVCRINDAHRDDKGELNTQYKEYVGTRCDYWLVSDKYIPITSNRSSLYKEIFVNVPNFKRKHEVIRFAEQNCQNYQNINFIPTEYESHINQSIVNFEPNWPSTGIIGIHFFLNHFDTVYLHGFDSFNPKYDIIDYYKPKRPNHFDKDSKNYVNTPDHNPSKEKQYIEYVTNNHNIKFL